MYLNYGESTLRGRGQWLTLTWDVFKLISKSFMSSSNHWLTLTWDVFKWLMKA